MVMVVLMMMVMGIVLLVMLMNGCGFWIVASMNVVAVDM